MHELSLCMSIAELVQEHARHAGVSRVTRVVVEIGMAAPVDPQALQFSFPVVTADTLMQGAALDIQRVPLRLRCKVCGLESEPVSPHEPCTSCGAFQREVLAGREMRVLSFETG